MNLPGFYALTSAWLFLLVIPLVVFYFLKLKRPRRDVPSLVLWQQVMNDQRVNSPFQRFKRNLLLLLQLLLLASLVLAAMQPFLSTGAERARYLPVLIDCSASMAATDSTGKSRLDVAKQRVGELIERLLPDQQLSLIAVSSTGRRVCEFTNNRRLLRSALTRIEIADVPSDLEDALRMTEALSRTVPIETVLIYSDGNFPDQIDFELPFELSFQQLPSATANISITALNARRSTADRWDVFVRVEASNSHTVSGNVHVLRDEIHIADDYVSLEEGESQRLVFQVDGTSASTIEVRLEADGPNSLISDDMARIVLPAGRPLRVYCDEDLSTFRHALRMLEHVELYPQGADSALANCDLLISDQADVQDLEASMRIHVGVLPTSLESILQLDDGASQVVDWRRTCPLLQHVQLSEVIFSGEPVSQEGIGERDYETLGFEILAHANRGPLVLRRREGTRLLYYFLVHLDQSTLPYRVGFPILVTNAVQIALQQASLSEVAGTSTGVLPTLTLQPDTRYTVESPLPPPFDVTSDDNGSLTGIAAPRVGTYTVRKGSDVVAELHAGLLSANESKLAAAQEIQFREVSVSAASSHLLENDRPLWPYFALAGFGILLFEWWYYQRRPSPMMNQRLAT